MSTRRQRPQLVDSLSCWAGSDRERLDDSGDDGASELSVELGTASRVELSPLLLHVWSGEATVGWLRDSLFGSELVVRVLGLYAPKIGIYALKKVWTATEIIEFGSNRVRRAAKRETEIMKNVFFVMGYGLWQFRRQIQKSGNRFGFVAWTRTLLERQQKRDSQTKTEFETKVYFVS